MGRDRKRTRVRRSTLEDNGGSWENLGEKCSRDLIFPPLLSFLWKKGSVDFSKPQRQEVTPTDGWLRAMEDVSPYLKPSYISSFIVDFFSSLCVYKSSSFEYTFSQFRCLLFFYRKLLADVITRLQPGHGISLPSLLYAHTLFLSLTTKPYITPEGRSFIFSARRLFSWISPRGEGRGGEGGSGGANLMDELAREYFHGKRRLRVRVGWLNANHDLRRTKRGKASRKKRDFSSPLLFIYYVKSNFAVRYRRV